MTYIVEKGHPMSGMCIVNEYDRDGGELQAQYKGWYKPSERKWTLYPLKNNSWAPMEKKILPESAVKMGNPTRKAGPPIRKSKTKEETQNGEQQLRLI